MTRLWKFAGASLALACFGAAQNLAPNVLLLGRVKSHMREELSHLPNYTCLETIVRFRNEPGKKSQFHGHLSPLDTVRLEIVYSNHREWYGSPGDRKLSADNPTRFIGGGMIGTGAFAMNLNSIIEGAIFTYRGEEAWGGRTAVKYDFRLPRVLGLEISIPGGNGTVGEEGSIWADLKSLDLLRLESHANEIPPYLPLEGASSNVNYARTRIGDTNALLAQQADLHTLETTGIESYDRLEFTHCRAFSAQTVVHFDLEPAEASDPAPSASLPDEPMQAVPALLQVTVQLATPITNTNTVGALIEGKILGDVLRKGKTVIPNGSVVRGRIRRLERYQGAGNRDFIVGLEFTEVVTSRGPMRFFADLLRMDHIPGVQPTLSEQVFVRDRVGGFQSREETITLPELPGVASFFIRGTDFTIPSGFRMIWRTRGLITSN